jgi:hypothetical protein
MKEKKNKHEKSESKSFEKKEKMQKTEPEYKTGKKNYKGKNF